MCFSFTEQNLVHIPLWAAVSSVILRSPCSLVLPIFGSSLLLPIVVSQLTIWKNKKYGTSHDEVGEDIYIVPAGGIILKDLIAHREKIRVE
jgi:hypothetical protein